MNLIKLLDVANPRRVKDTINLLIQDTESFEARIGPIAEHAEAVAEQALASSAAVATAAAQAVVDSKVDKVTGKGLSTEDYTTAEKQKLASLSLYESDPTVPAWAKAPTKPSYNYSEIGNTPIIPVVNDPTIIITQGGIEKGRFTLNQANDGTIALDAGGSTSLVTDVQIDDNTVVINGIAKLYAKTAYNASTNKFVTESDLPSALADLIADSTHRLVTDTEKSTWNAKQDAISDLSTIRSGAAAGAIALQSGDNISELTNDAGYLTQHQDISDVVIHDDTVDPATDPTILDNYYTKGQIIDLIYPIGSVFITVNNVNPSTYLPNTNWEALAEGKTLWTTTTNGTGGDEISAGLPNIVGSATRTMGAWQDGGTGTGAIYRGSSGGQIGSSGTAINKYTLQFDASRSNPIYGNSDTVQPPAIKVYMWKRIPLANS